MPALMKMRKSYQALRRNNPYNWGQWERMLSKYITENSHLATERLVDLLTFAILSKAIKDYRHENNTATEEEIEQLVRQEIREIIEKMRNTTLAQPWEAALNNYIIERSTLPTELLVKSLTSALLPQTIKDYRNGGNTTITDAEIECLVSQYITAGVEKMRTEALKPTPKPRARNS